jgi:hypothetical protein
MKPIRLIVILTTVYLVIYTLVSNLTLLPAVALVSMWIFGHVLLVYMVVRVLRKGVPSTRTFDEGYWYEDRGKMDGGWEE